MNFSKTKAHEPEVGEIYASLCRPESGALSVDRRRFLQGSLALGGAAALGPSMFANEAAALGDDDRILVCVYMAGGNDGLNMIAPLDSGAYFDARKSLSIDATNAHKIAKNRYLHPMLGGLAERYRAGEVAIVEGVGFADDDHSHFSSIKTWMGASTYHGPGASGWLGRYLEQAGLDGLGGVNIGDSGVPLLMVGKNSTATALPTDGNLFGADVEEKWEEQLIRVFTDLGAGDIGRSEMANMWAAQLGSAIGVAGQVSPIYNQDIAERNLVRNMTLAANLINLDVGSRVISTSFQTFDTHDDQAAEHAARLLEFDNALTAFYANLKPRYRDRVVVMTFSEFGRRVEANNSRGTDHGTAGPMMMIGPSVKSGFHGKLPSLTRLDDRGDLKHTVDFREVYASVLSGWLGADSASVLGANFETLDLFGAPATAGTPDPVPNEPTPDPDPSTPPANDNTPGNDSAPPNNDVGRTGAVPNKRRPSRTPGSARITTKAGTSSSLQGTPDRQSVMDRALSRF